MTKGFTHLHLHTEHSLLDGAAHIKRVVKSAKELGMEAIAITDHGVMYGVVEFWRECEKQGIKPIIGCEVYVASRSLYDKVKGVDDKPYHLVLLVENEEGYKNLIKIVSKAHIDGFYYKPRTDLDYLRDHSKGLICLSACLQGEVQQHLLNYNYNAAKDAALEYQKIFGKDNYFLEVQNQFLKDEEQIYPDMKKLSQELGIPLVATNDVHYVNREDAEMHDILLCIQTQAKRADEDRMRFPNDQFYLKSEEEMRSLFEDLPEACDNTMKIAQRCNFDFKFGDFHLPEFKPPAGLTNTEYLRQLCEKGLHERYGDKAEEVRDRMEKELSIIENMGYVEYFLIVWDFINYAREHDIMVGPGRGSAAGSVVAYCLKITSVDPIRYNLIFERFLNPERISMPDIDIDFCFERRGEVIDYVTAKYGSENVSQIVTFNTLKPKAAIRDVARVLDIPIFKTDKIAKMIPKDLDITIDKALEKVPELAEEYQQDPETRTLIDMAKTIEGMPRNISVHAAGVVITKEPLDNYVPLAKSDQVVITQFEKNTVEELGLLKMDFLGLRNLTVIQKTIDLIQEGHGVKIDFTKMDMDDPDVYNMIAQGNTQAVFQLESSGMTEFMKELKPNCFEDIVAGISLYRPGPMDSIPAYINNRKHPDQVKYLDPLLEPILDVTHGVLIYQEQVMQIVRKIAGYSYGRADVLRRAMSKKKIDEMLAQKQDFMDGCRKHNISQEVAQEIFSQMESFAQYAFNKSHAAVYAVVAYQTAYLKYHYPAEYMASRITSVLGDGTGKVARYIRNCEEMGISVLPPNVNKSKVDFSVESQVLEDGSKKQNIRFGLGAVTHVGEAAAKKIVEAASEHGPFNNLSDFIGSLDLVAVSKKSIKQLILAGAMSDFEGNRRQLHEVVDDMVDDMKKEASSTAANQMNMFDMFDTAFNQVKVERKLPKIDDFSQQEIYKLEKETLGVYISGHPIDEYEDIIKNEGLMTLEADQEIDEMDEMDEESKMESKLNMTYNGYKDGDRVELIAMIVEKKQIFTKNNEAMAFVTVEDQFGQAELVVFPRVYEKAANYIQKDQIVRIKGSLQIDQTKGDLKILASEIGSADSCTLSPKFLKIKMPETDAPKIMLKSIESVTDKSPGSTVMIVYMPDGSRMVKREPGVNVDDQMLADLEEMLGQENVKLS